MLNEQPEFDFIADSHLRQAFIAFHNENPHVYAELFHLAMELKELGHKHYGISGLFEVLRWKSALKTIDPEGYKLNNNHRAYYARMIMENHPQLKGFFRTRQVK